MLLRCKTGLGLWVGLGLLSWPVAGDAPAYVTSAACAECHADATAAWADSHHGWAWRPATPDNVLGDFSGSTFEHRGMRSRFFRESGRFIVETDGPEGQPSRWEIHSTVGVAPLQQYLVALDDGRLQALDIAWDTTQRRWYHLEPERALEDDPGLHWTGPYKNWNSRCVSCHVTGFVKGYAPKENRYRSTWSEMGVGCEACHGPGETHVAWARQSSEASPTPALNTTVASSTVTNTAAPELYDGVDSLGLTVSLGGARQAELEVCARCHARRESLGADSPPPGEPFADHYRLSLLREGLYFADGQIDDEVYVYGSFLQAKKHARGVSCSNCHQPHSGRLVAEGNALCTQCHNPEGRPDFPTLPRADFDVTDHHQHAVGSEAARCVSCHMPERTYMGVDPRRDHSFRVPRPDLSAELGVPNACNGCHTDRSVDWAQEQVATWYPQGRHLRPHFGQVLHAARQRLDPETAERLIELAFDPGTPSIARASAIELLAPVVTPQIAGATLPLLEDHNPWLRTATLGLFHSAPAAARTRHAGPLLDDPTRVVRIAAAQRILDVSTSALGEADRAIVDAAVEEYRTSLTAQADFPEVQLNLARVAERLGQTRTAQHSLRTALTLDAKLDEAWLRLAQLEIGAGRLEAARTTLRRATTELSRSGPLHQLLGRVLAQLGDGEAAVEAFEAALDQLPDALEVRLETVSLLTELGQHQRALKLLAQTPEGVRGDPQMLYLLALNHAQAGALETAWAVARLFAELHPEHPLHQPLRTALENP